MLIVGSLERSTPRNELRRYFEPKAVRPEFSQIVSLAKAVATQVGRKEASFNLRQERASKCSNCAIHRKHDSIATAANSMIKKAVDLVSDKSHESLAELNFSKLEQELGVCGMCGCKLSTKIRINVMSALNSVHPNQIDRLLNDGAEAFDACWILSEALADPTIRKTLEDKLNRTKGKVGRALLVKNIQRKHIAAAKDKHKG